MKKTMYGSVSVLLLLGAMNLALAEASAKLVSIPGENAGESFSLEVDGKKISDPEGYLLYTTEKEQLIETSQVSLKLSKSPLKFDHKGKFIGLVPLKGIVKSSSIYAEFKTSKFYDYDEYFECFLTVHGSFRIKKVCSRYVEIKNPDGSPSFATAGLPGGELRLRIDGTLADMRYEVPNLLYGSNTFPLVQGQSIRPYDEPYGRKSIYATVNLSFYPSGSLSRAYGNMMFGDSSRVESKKEMILNSDALPAQKLILWEYSSGLGLELDEDGRVAGGTLARSMDGFRIYSRGHVGDIGTRHYFDAEVKSVSILDPKSMGYEYDANTLLKNTCEKLGTKVDLDPLTNPFVGTTFYSFSRVLRDFDLAVNAKFYNPMTGKVQKFKKGDHVAIMKDVYCPEIPTFKKL